MEARELAKILQEHPGAEVRFKDRNFPGAPFRFEPKDITFDGEVFVIDPPPQDEFED